MFLKLFGSLLIAVILLSTHSTFAQEPTVSESASSEEIANAPIQQVIRVASVNIQNASFTQSGNTFNITFDLSNGEGVQPGIKYGVLLVENGLNGQVIADQEVYPEEIVLGSGESVTRKITYTPPKVFAGKYQLYLTSRNENSFPFGLNFMGEVTLIDIPNEELKIDASSCKVFVKDDVDAIAYGLQDGVDINADEVIMLRCLVMNTSANLVNLKPIIATYDRTPFGANVKTNSEPIVSPKSIGPKSKEMVEVILPTSQVPQAYDVVLSFGLESNNVIARYVIRGGSATIQNTVLDKSYYQPGDIAKISLSWSPAADNFRDSRSDSPTMLERPRITINLSTKDEVICGSISDYALPSIPLISIEVPITNVCENPKVTFKVTDDKYGTLDEIEYIIPSPVVDGEVATSVTPVIEANDNNNKNLLIGVIVLIIISLLIFVITIIFKGKSINLAIVLGFITWSMFGIAVEVTHADTFIAYDWGGDRTVTYTVNLNKGTYSPGETISITGGGTANSSCGNSCMVGGACRGVGLWVSSHTGGGSFPNYIIPEGNISATQGVGGNLNISAAATNGPHSIGITGTAMFPALRSNSISMGYTVVAPTSCSYTGTLNWVEATGLECSVAVAYSNVPIGNEVTSTDSNASGNTYTGWIRHRCNAAGGWDYQDHTCSPRVNCVGSWSNNSTCSATCGGGVLEQVYTVTTPASGGGTACPFTNGATQWGSTSCNTQACPSIDLNFI